MISACAILTDSAIDKPDKVINPGKSISDFSRRNFFASERTVHAAPNPSNATEITM